MRIERVADCDKARHRALLSLADEQRELMEDHLWRGGIWVAVEEGQVVGACVATDEGDLP